MLRGRGRLPIYLHCSLALRGNGGMFFIFACAKEGWEGYLAVA